MVNHDASLPMSKKAKMKFIIALMICSLLSSLCPAAQVDDTVYPKLLIEGKTYEEVRVTKITDTYAYLRFKGGMRRLKLEELPEPLKTKYYRSGLAQKGLPPQGADGVFGLPIFLEDLKQQRLKFINEFKAYKVANGRLYDFTEVIVNCLKGRFQKEVIDKDFLLIGKVLQVKDDGILFEQHMYQEKRYVYLKKGDSKTAFAEGAALVLFAAPIGYFQYVTDGGMEIKLPQFALAKPYTAKDGQFKTITRLTDQFYHEYHFNEKYDNFTPLQDSLIKIEQTPLANN
jgi:hypothetical protein